MEKRKMGNERLHLRSPNINVCFKADIIGDFTEDDFRHAVDAVAMRHPMVNCVVRHDDTGDVWYLPEKSKIGIEYYSGVGISAWREWYEKIDSIPFDFEHGPLVKIGVFRNDNTAVIVIIGHHILGDGLGYLNLFKDVLLSLDGKLNTMPMLPPEQAILKQKTKIGILSGYFGKKLNKSWQKNAKSFSHDDYIEFFNAYRQKNPPCMYLGSMDGIKFTKLLAACKQNNVTVNEAIATAFTAALQNTDKRYMGKQIRFGCAASIRDELETSASDCMGNFVTGIATTVCYDNDKPFAENAKMIGLNLRKKLTNPKTRYLVLNFLSLLDKDFIESALFATYGNYDNPVSKKLGELLGEQNHDKGIGVSNLGRQKTVDYNNITVSGITFIPPAFPANLINIGVMTINNYMGFCLRYSESDISDGMVERIYQMAVTLLTE